MANPKKKPRANPSSAGEPLPAELLLEIGTEELPYQFIPPALRTLGDSAAHFLKEHRLSHGAVRTFGTPRRLVLVVASLASRQAATVKETMGPSKAHSFDAAGQPTKAAVGFAGSQGVSVKDLEIRQTPKGDYAFAVKREPGHLTHKLLADFLPSLIEQLSFPRSMRWNESGMRFARPIRWLLALYGGKVVNFQVGGILSSDRTWGHRFLSFDESKTNQWVRVNDFMSYVKTLERRGVIPDQEQRREMILSQLTRLTHSVRGNLHRDDDLLEQAIYTVEYPYAILGTFAPQYLSLPKVVLMTAMKEHQGFFSVMHRDGTLLPKFISVTNMKLADMRLIREGNERVLAARLADAKFFFDEDRKFKLADRVEKLKGVIFHQKLGTQHQRTDRIVALATTLAGMLGGDQLIKTCRRAAELSKADLLTGIVGEFPTLQGEMGREYARHDGEPDAVSLALGEQYLPRAMEGELPKTLEGKILSLADRLGMIVAFFHVGIVPTGSEDPFGLRRHASAVVRILVEGNLWLNLSEATTHAKELVQSQGLPAALPAHTSVSPKGGSSEPLDFIAERLRYYGRTVHGLRDDVMESVLKPAAKKAFVLSDLLARMKALQAITTRQEFDPLMVGFKRAHRLVQKEKWSRDFINPKLVQHPAEKELNNVLSEVEPRFQVMMAKSEYAKALEELVRMKPVIDQFFVGVMVNADDPALRENRLSMLYKVDVLFQQFADFSQIVVQGT